MIRPLLVSSVMAVAAAAAAEPGSIATLQIREDLEARLGAKPFACADVGRGQEICTWRFGNRDAPWRELAAAVPTDDRVNLVCLLPADGSARAPGSCSVHPRRSNRYDWVPLQRRTKMRQPKREPKAQREARARAELDAARTLLEVTRLVGKGPDGCRTLSSGMLHCHWYTDAHTHGHGTLAVAAGGEIQKKIHLACEFPGDGSPRAPESCSVGVGAKP